MDYTWEKTKVFIAGKEIKLTEGIVNEAIQVDLPKNKKNLEYIYRKATGKNHHRKFFKSRN